MSLLPPHYILFSHSSAANSNTTIAHPVIQYHYANDSPLALWPQHPNEHVLVFDYDPTGAKSPAIQSMSKDIAVTSHKIEEAPGAAAAHENDPRNDRMYTIETTANDGLPSDRCSTYNTIIRFKARNALLRHTLLYPESNSPKQLPSHLLPHSEL